jgi:hypothetical protein
MRIKHGLNIRIIKFIKPLIIFQQDEILRERKIIPTLIIGPKGPSRSMIENEYYYKYFGDISAIEYTGKVIPISCSKFGGRSYKYEFNDDNWNRWYKEKERCNFCKELVERRIMNDKIELILNTIIAKPFVPVLRHSKNNPYIRKNICFNCTHLAKIYIKDIENTKCLKSELFQILNIKLHKNLVNMVIEYTSILATLSKK